jgi:methylglutaconyl-CoA hydratase
VSVEDIIWGATARILKQFLDMIDEEATWLTRPLASTVDALARTLAGFSPTALGLAKEAAATSTGMEYDAALRYLRELLTLVALSDDAREGIKAFFEKRAPNWTGR